jgi:hypothetical protein
VPFFFISDQILMAEAFILSQGWSCDMMEKGVLKQDILWGF